MNFLGNFFTFPVMLIGLAAAAIPIIIHLIFKRKAPHQYFSDLRFLQSSFKKTSRRRRIQDIVLLMLRSLLFALLAMGFAQPVVNPPGFSGANVAIALVVDNSYSMQQKSKGQTLLEKGKDYIYNVFSKMKSGDKCALIITNGPKSGDETQFIQDLNYLQTQTAQLQVGAGPSNIESAIKKAYALFDESKELNKELYIISDAQKISWADVAEERTTKRPRDVPVVVIDCAEPVSKNLSVLNAQILSRNLIKNTDLILQAEILNSTGSDEYNLPVSLYLDGNKVQEKAVDVAANAKQSVQFVTAITTSGIHTGFIQIPDDDIQMDNLYRFAFTVSDEIPVLIIKEEYAPVKFLDESYFLTKAFSAMNVGGISSAIKYGEELINDIGSTDLSHYKVVFLLNVRGFDQQNMQLIKSYVRKGGCVVFFPGDGTSGIQLSTLLYDNVGEFNLLPGTIREPFQIEIDNKEPWYVSQIDDKHPIFTPFVGQPFSLLESIQVKKYLPITVLADSGSIVIARYNSGEPFIIERNVGQGKAVFFTTSANTGWTNFPTKKAFLPIIFETIYYLAQIENVQKDNYLPGTKIVLNFPERTDPFTLELTPPESAGTIKVDTFDDKGVRRATITDTYTTGVYSYRATTSPFESGLFLINPDTRESVMERLDKNDIHSLLPNAPSYVINSTEELEFAFTRIRKGMKLIDYFVFIVLVIAIGELFFANFVKPKKIVAKKENPLHDENI